MVTRWIITNLSSWTRWSWTADLVALYVRGHVFGKRSNAPVDAGYSFYVAERLAISLGGEIGVSTFFAGDDVFALPHYGPSVYLFFR
jgi:hypothetical protein